MKLHSCVLSDIYFYYSTNCDYAHIWLGSPQYLSSVHDRYPAIYVTDHIWTCTAALSRLAHAAMGVFAVFFRKFKNTLSKIFQGLMLLKSQQVFASAYKDIQRLFWNFQSESSTKKMLLRAKQKFQTCLLELGKFLSRFQSTGRGTYSRFGSNIYFFWLLTCHYQTWVCKRVYLKWTIVNFDFLNFASVFVICC